MLRGYRCIVLAAVGWLILTGADKPAKQTESGGGRQEAQAAPATKPAYSPYPDKYAERCYDAQDHDTADLCAQWRAAIAAEKAAHEARRATNWAIVATFLGFATIVGLIVTIWQTFGALGEARRGNRIAMKANARATRQAVESVADTKRALEIADRNAQAMQRSADLAERASKARLRPYVCLTSFNDEEQAIPLDFSKQGYLRFKIKNYGQLPARNVMIRQDAGLFPLPVGDAEVILSKPGEEVGALVPGDSRPTTSYFYGLPEEAFIAVKNGPNALLIRIRIDYELPDGTTDFDENTLVISKFHIDSGMGCNRLTREERERKPQ